MYRSENEKLNRFIELRNQYIDMLESKSIDKSKFNHLNNEIFQKINLRPFVVLDSFEKALYNYNYYNSKAKIALEDYLRCKTLNREKKAKEANNNKNNFYYHKDLAILAMLKLENFKDVEAYYIDMHSKSLASQIFEINFPRKDRIILHTKNIGIRDQLKDKGCFNEECKTSLIENYINN